MNNRDIVRKLLEEEDDFEGDLGMDFSKVNAVRKMKERKEKLGGGKPKREKPNWKKLDCEE